MPALPQTIVCVVGELGEQARAETDIGHASHVLRTNFEGPALLLNAPLGLASVLHMLLILDGASAVGLFAAVALVEIWLLYRFIRGSRTELATHA